MAFARVKRLLGCFGIAFGGTFLLSAKVAEAQLPLKLGISAGISSPAGDLSKFTDAGYNVSLLSELRLPVLPVGLRLEGSLNHFTWDRNQVTGISGGARSLSATANGIVDFPSTVLLKFYGIGGTGVYRVTNAVDVGGGTFEKRSSTKAGFNGGVGVRLPVGPIAGFFEVRYHYIAGGDGFNFVPISLGIRF